MKLAAALLLVSCASQKPIVASFNAPEDFNKKGPAFVCVRADDARRELNCIDLGEFLDIVARHRPAEL